MNDFLYALVDQLVRVAFWAAFLFVLHLINKYGLIGWLTGASTP